MTEIYPNIKDKNFINKIYNKKEFIINERFSEFTYEDELNDITSLMFKSHQLFIKNYMSVFTPYRKLLVYHAVGSGKTLSAWAAAETFINEFKKYNPNEITPKIYIVGFTKNLFKTEYIKWPDLGFVRIDEMEELIKIKEKSGYDSAEYIKERTNLVSRLTNRKYNGYFKFLGYRELFNKLFKKTDDMSDLDINSDKLNFKLLLKYIKEGKIKVDTELLNTFNNSFLICDEIHNLYNTEKINNQGLAIIYITLFIKNLKSIYLTATPLNNNPREIIDLVNLLCENIDELLEPNYYNELIKRENSVEEIEKLIKDKLTGKISVYEDIDLRYYPKRIILGEKIKNISLLKFKKCNMSDYYFDNYIKLINYNEEENYTTFDVLNKMYEDIILPDNINNDNLILQKPEFWQNKHQLYYDKEKEYSFGQFYNITKLEKYSPKYYNMLNELKNIEGKVFIYHKYIYKSGCNMIASILRENGYIEYNDTINNSTKCSICYKYFNEVHKNHDFLPLKYILYTGSVENNLKKELVQMYNNYNNIKGYYIKTLIGSKVIEEGVSLYGVNNCFVMSFATNISTLMQVIGRVTRKDSHINLDKNKQYVNIHILIHSMTKTQKKIWKKKYNISIPLEEVYSIEEVHYKRKTEDHLEIQFIEKIIKQNAIDGYLYPSNTYDDDLGYIFDPLKDYSVTINYKSLEDFTYIHHDYINNVLDFTIIYIKNILNQYKILHINDIIDFFNQHNYIIEYNTRLINKNFILYIVNKLLIYNNYNNHIINNIYKLENQNYIIRIDDYIILVNDINNIYNDIFNNQIKSKQINCLKFIDNIDNDIISIYKKIEKKLEYDIDFFEFFNYNIPNHILKNQLNISNNIIVKKIMKIFNLNKKEFNSTIGFIDSSHKFKIKNSFFEKGVACNSLKKNDFNLYLINIINLEPNNIKKHSIRELCYLTKITLFKMEIENNFIRYFSLKL